MKLFRRSKLHEPPAKNPTQPIETGTVAWQRSLDQALGQAMHSGKPVFALFQEVPGCAGCQQFGADVLSDRTIVDAIEHEFVPLLIHNNSPGPDAEVLARYHEPAWNFQVVRFLGSNGLDLIERRDRVWEAGPLAARMIQALQVANRLAPPYLVLAEQERSDRLDTAYLAQPCFWVGEMELGQIDGVVRTEAGFINGYEVTKVDFDPQCLTSEMLVADATTRKVATQVFYGQDAAKAYRRAPDSDQKRQLGHGRNPGASPAQLTKLNAFVGNAQTAKNFLPPSLR